MPTMSEILAAVTNILGDTASVKMMDTDGIVLIIRGEQSVDMNVASVDMLAPINEFRQRYIDPACHTLDEYQRSLAG